MAASVATASTLRCFTAGERFSSLWIWLLHSVSSTNSPSMILRSASITPLILSRSPSRSGPGSRFRVGITSVPRRDHRFERPALVLDVALRRFHEIRDQVVAALQLDVDLRKGVLEAVALRNQPVVDRDQPHDGRDDDADDNPESPAHVCLLPSRADSVIVYDDGSGKLVVPALLALVESDPKKSQAQGNERNEIGEEAPNQLPRGGLTEIARLDNPCLEQHFSRRRAAEPPEHDRRDNQCNLHLDVEQCGNRRVGMTQNFQYSCRVGVRIARGGRQACEFSAQTAQVASPAQRKPPRWHHDHQ